MNYSISRNKAVSCVLAATAVMSGCSLLPGRGSSSGGFSSRGALYHVENDIFGDNYKEQ